MIFKFGGQLQPVEIEEWEAERSPAVFVTDARHAEETLARAGIIYENEIRLEKIGFCKIQFLYNFIAEFMSRDQEMLVAYERRLLRMEEDVTQEHTETFQNRLMPIRRELLNLRSYYDEMMDLTKELEENENGFFLKKHLKYFGTLSDRADRLMSRTVHLLEYAQQVKEAYQAQIDARQNSNMQFLTVLSTIFFPLTLITGWFGMNFRDMPGLDNGYPAVMALSVIVILICIYIFKKKKII